MKASRKCTLKQALSCTCSRLLPGACALLSEEQAEEIVRCACSRRCGFGSAEDVRAQHYLRGKHNQRTHGSSSGGNAPGHCESLVLFSRNLSHLKSVDCKRTSASCQSPRAAEARSAVITDRRTKAPQVKGIALQYPLVDILPFLKEGDSYRSG